MHCNENLVSVGLTLLISYLNEEKDLIWELK